MHAYFVKTLSYLAAKCWNALAHNYSTSVDFDQSCKFITSYFINCHLRNPSTLFGIFGLVISLSFGDVSISMLNSSVTKVFCCCCCCWAARCLHRKWRLYRQHLPSQTIPPATQATVLDPVVQSRVKLARIKANF